MSYVNISPESWLLLAIGFLLSLIPTYYFYRRAKKEPIGCYFARGLNVIDIGEKPDIREKVTVSYDSEPIPRLSVGIVAFWNGGTSVLDGSALVQRDPLRITVHPDGKILDATIVANPNPECDCRVKFDCEVEPKSVLIDFDFLNPNNGIAVRILHTAQAHGLEVGGTLKGVRLEHQWGSASTQAFQRISELGNLKFILLIFAISASSMVGITLIRDHGIPLPASLLELRYVIGYLSIILLLCLLAAQFLAERSSHKIPQTLKGP